MAKKVNLGNGKFIEQTNKKRPGRHSKVQINAIVEKNIEVKVENNNLFTY
jgi:hypothetical protein